MRASRLPSHTSYGRVTVSAFPAGVKSPWLLYSLVRKAVVTVVGGSVVLVGAIMIVTPGPAFVVIPAGLAILATEFAWAKWLLDRARKQAMDAVRAVRGPMKTGAVSCGGIAGVEHK